MILSSEMTRKRVKYVKKIVKEGREEVLRVIRLDTTQGYIDLSKKSVKPEEVEEFKEKYFKSKTVHHIMKILAIKTKQDLEKLYTTSAWPLYRIYGHAYIAFKEALNDEDAVFSKLDIDANTRKELMEILKTRMVPQPVKIRADFKLTCYKFEGIDAIKAALLEGEKLSTPEISIKFHAIGSPIYEVTTTTINKADGLKLIGQALKTVENSIRLREGNFLLQTKPTILGESAEKGLQEQLNQVKNMEQDIDEGNNIY
jgi:translation initiation factor 2 subunit 1